MPNYNSHVALKAGGYSNDYCNLVFRFKHELWHKGEKEEGLPVAQRS